MSLRSRSAGYGRSAAAVLALVLWVGTPGGARTETAVREPPSFDDAGSAAAEMPRLRSLLISWNGELLLERYYNGARPDRVANIKSASKSVVSALVGIAIERGFLEGVDQTIGSFFPEILANEDPRKRNITIGDLLTMQSGLTSTSNRNYGAWVSSTNWIRYALSRPLEREPGTWMIYSTGNTHLLSAILTQATGMTTWRFAQENLARPMGFSLAQWTRDPQGIYFGGNEMGMTPSQMLAFGEMYLNRGRSNDRQILSSEWVDQTFIGWTFSPRELGRFYGYGWWVRDLGGWAVHYAWGYGGQFIFVVPGLDLVVVTTSDPNPGPDRRGHNSRIYSIVEDLVIGPITAASTPELPEPL